MYVLCCHCINCLHVYASMPVLHCFIYSQGKQNLTWHCDDGRFVKYN